MFRLKKRRTWPRSKPRRNDWSAKKFCRRMKRAALDLKAVAAFWNSEAGQKIRRAGGECEARTGVHGEIQSGRNWRKSSGQNQTPELENEFVVVQGVADLVVLLPEEIWLVDFKTDEVRADELAEKIKIYAPQLKLYASALAKIYSRPVTNCWLHFLSAQKTVAVEI